MRHDQKLKDWNRNDVETCDVIYQEKILEQGAKSLEGAESHEVQRQPMTTANYHEQFDETDLTQCDAIKN